jgi:hypothetical protein
MKKIDDEEIIEMQSDEKGTYHPIAVVKVSKEQKNPPARASSHFQKYIPAFYEVIDGFVMGLGAIENFVMNMKKLDGRIKQ